MHCQSFRLNKLVKLTDDNRKVAVRNNYMHCTVGLLSHKSRSVTPL